MIKLPLKIRKMFNRPDGLKALATTDADGNPHVVVKSSLCVLDDGRIAYAEDLDTSVTSTNMVRALWFDKTVSIMITNGPESYQIKGRPYKCLITGPVFREFLLREKKQGGKKNDIQAVWIINPLETKDQGRTARKKEELKKYPLHNIHLDLLAKKHRAVQRP